MDQVSLAIIVPERAGVFPVVSFMDQSHRLPWAFYVRRGAGKKPIDGIPAVHDEFTIVVGDGRRPASLLIALSGVVVFFIIIEG